MCVCLCCGGGWVLATDRLDRETNKSRGVVLATDRLDGETNKSSGVLATDRLDTETNKSRGSGSHHRQARQGD